MSGFSAQQRRLLEAMGYVLLQRLAPPLPAAEVAAGAQAPAPSERPVPHAGDSTPIAPLDAARDAPLWSHILRALGGPPERAGLFLVEQGPALQFDGPRLGLNLAALRQDPEAKRRLWRTLRELRPD